MSDRDELAQELRAPTVHMRSLGHPTFTICGLTDVRNGETGELLRTVTMTNFDDEVTCEGCR